MKSAYLAAQQDPTPWMVEIRTNYPSHLNGYHSPLFMFGEYSLETPEYVIHEWVDSSLNEIVTSAVAIVYHRSNKDGGFIRTKTIVLK